MTTLVRPAVEADYDALQALYYQIDALHHEALPAIFRDPRRVRRSRLFLTDLMQDEDVAYLVAETDGRVSGLVHATVRDLGHALMQPTDYAHIYDIIVDPAFQRQGVGAALITAVERWARERGVDLIQLHVWEFNEPALAFYEKRGFTTANRTLWRKLGD